MVVAESRAACNLAVECRKGVIPLACNMMRCRRFSTGFFSAVLEVAGRSMRSDVVRAKFDADHWFIAFCSSLCISMSSSTVDTIRSDHPAVALDSLIRDEGMVV